MSSTLRPNTGETMSSPQKAQSARSTISGTRRVLPIATEEKNMRKSRSMQDVTL
eukprot:Pgem_evm1s12766